MTSISKARSGHSDGLKGTQLHADSLTMNTSPTGTFEINKTDAYMFLMCTLEYALSRKSYVVGFAMDKIREWSPNLSHSQRLVMIRELENYTTSPTAYAKADWLHLLNELRAMNKSNS